VLLPGERISLRGGEVAQPILERARGFGGAVVASLVDGESVHEVGVTAVVAGEEGGEASLHGVCRCRLLALVSDEVTLVRAERFPEPARDANRVGALARLLLARYERLCQRTGKAQVPLPSRSDLSALTWKITAEVGLSTDQQQGFLNVPDPLTRGRLLLVAVREVEQRERFLRRWAHLRSARPWN